MTDNTENQGRENPGLQQQRGDEQRPQPGQQNQQGDRVRDDEDRQDDGLGGVDRGDELPSDVTDEAGVER
jgi:hypothetical protein